MEMAAIIKRFEYLPLGSELIEQTDIAKEQYCGLDKVPRFDKNDLKIDKEELQKIKFILWNFYKHKSIKNHGIISFASKCDYLKVFHDK